MFNANSGLTSSIQPSLEYHRRPQESERRLPNGNIPEYACGPLKKPRYIN